jgi:hypothetical protein
MKQINQISTPQSIEKTTGRNYRPVAASRTRQDGFARRTFFVITLLPVFLILDLSLPLPGD